MSKFVLKGKPEEEIKVGDSLTVRIITQLGTVMTSRTIDEQYLKELIRDGIVVEVSEDPIKEEINLFYVIEHLAKRAGWKVENLKKYIENLYTISPTAVYQILLKECAIIIDSPYKDHISKAKKLWAISIVDGQIFEVVPGQGNITNVALFRTYKDAEIAREILAIIGEDIF